MEKGRSEAIETSEQVQTFNTLASKNVDKFHIRIENFGTNLHYKAKGAVSNPHLFSLLIFHHGI